MPRKLYSTLSAFLIDTYVALGKEAGHPYVIEVDGSDEDDGSLNCQNLIDQEVTVASADGKDYAGKVHDVVIGGPLPVIEVVLS